MTTTITAKELYQRQITLLGQEAMDRIGEAKVLVVGAGGLGCPALQYLSSAGVGKIGILDHDVVSVSNLQRQVLFTLEDVGVKKVEAAKNRLKSLAPLTEFSLFPHALTVTNAQELISPYDIVLDCTDNFHTKFLLHDACFQQKKFLIQASVYQFEGQIHCFDFQKQSGPCLRCLWPEQPLDGCVGSCAEVGVMGPLLGVMGSLQAMEALKQLSGRSGLKNGESLFVDLNYHSYDVRRFKQNPECSCCVKREFHQEEELQVSLPDELEDFVLIDVRSQEEFDQCQLIHDLKSKRLLHIPLNEVENFLPFPEEKYLILCAKGFRSLRACKTLREKHPDIYSLRGGIESLSLSK